MNVEEFMPNDLDVQKAVVESLAADKAVQDEKIETMRNENVALKAEANQLKSEIAQLKSVIEEMKAKLGNVGDLLAKNSEIEVTNRIALLERDIELDDRFPGETRDHVLEVIKAAKDVAEQEGRLRRAQVLEGVLIANEPSGNLAKRRAALEKLFSENANIVSGIVIEELQKRGISHKNGEDYLLPSEIIKRTY